MLLRKSLPLMREVARSAGGRDIKQHFSPPPLRGAPSSEGALSWYHRYTHVLVNDPTKGYGIFIENMLDAAG